MSRLDWGNVRSAFEWFLGSGLIFIVCAAWLYLPDILFAPPAGIHYIRQTDTLSFIARYFDGTGFISPEVFDLRNNPNDGRTAAEFPLLYWLTAKLYNLFGERIWLLRCVNLAMVLVGQIMFGRACGAVLRSRALGMLFSFWIFGSSVLVYYACNSLPDATAYGIVLVGWSVVLREMADGLVKKWRFALLLFVLAALCKVTSGIHLLAFGLVLLLQSIAEQTVAPLFMKIREKALWLIGGIIAVASWSGYSIWYNKTNGASHFITTFGPVWSLDNTEQVEVVKLVTEYWWSKYLYPTSWHVLGAIVLAGSAFIGRAPRLLLVAAIVLVLGSACYVILFYERFRDHDYYFVALLPTLALSALLGLVALRSRFPKVLPDPTLALAMLVLSLLSINYAKLNLDRRYAEQPDRYSAVGTALVDLPLDLGTAGVTTDATFVVLGDNTPNGSLLSLDHKGWTYPGYPVATKPDWVELRKLGADYLLCIDQSPPQGDSLDLILRGKRWTIWSLSDHD